MCLVMWQSLDLKVLQKSFLAEIIRIHFMQRWDLAPTLRNEACSNRDICVIFLYHGFSNLWTYIDIQNLLFKFTFSFILTLIHIWINISTSRRNVCLTVYLVTDPYHHVHAFDEAYSTVLRTAIRLIVLKCCFHYVIPMIRNL
jgi:hypothetical protein